jgi:hypothetical protein
LCTPFCHKFYPSKASTLTPHPKNFPRICDGRPLPKQVVVNNNINEYTGINFMALSKEYQRHGRLNKTTESLDATKTLISTTCSNSFWSKTSSVE